MTNNSIISTTTTNHDNDSLNSSGIAPLPPGANQPLTMSSLEIAELTGKRHDNVMRDIRVMLVELYGEGGILSFEDTHLNTQNGQTYPVFRLPKDLTLTLVARYDANLCLKIIRRWMELEEQVRNFVPALPDFTDPSAAARAWADERDGRIVAERTKAQIGQRREATAMNTASQAVKKVNRLEAELDKSRSYATIKRMTMLYHGQTFKWHLLKKTSEEMGLPSLAVFDQNYGTVNAYHADVWLKAYALEIPGPSSD